MQIIDTKEEQRTLGRSKKRKKYITCEVSFVFYVPLVRKEVSGKPLFTPIFILSYSIADSVLTRQHSSSGIRLDMKYYF